MENPQNPGLDPRLQPTPDYGTLGRGSDIAQAAMNTNGDVETAGLNPTGDPRVAPLLAKVYATAGKTQPNKQASLAVVALGIGMGLAMPIIAMGGQHGIWSRIGEWLASRGQEETSSPASVSKRDMDRLDRVLAQRQAELLLSQTISHYDGAGDQLVARVDSWHGHVKMTPNLEGLVTAALNAGDMRVREAGIEVDLAAYNIPKTADEAREMRHRADEGDHATRIWALWTLGALANRGVEPEVNTDSLIAHLKDDNPVDRQWAVEGLALVGSDATIAPLLKTFHDDPSPMVRERAACSLAQSGMLKKEQRMTVVPEILTYTEDAALDAQTHTWAFQALRDITGQALPNETLAWREWWENRQRSGWGQ
jgi:HEAT repeat protein